MIDNSKTYLKKLVSVSQNSVKSFGYEKITVTGTLATLTIPDGATYALCILESTATGTAARILQNKGTTVTASVGMPILAGAIFDISDYANLDGFQIIKDQAGTTSLYVEYFK